MTLSLEDYWRGIVLYGKNVASYKFALAKSLLEIKPDEGQLIQLEELAPVFSKHICEHLKKNDKQGTSGKSKFLEACRAHNNGDITYQSLLDTTTKYGFVNVIEAFHVVGGAPIDTPFFIDERKTSKGIRIATEFSQLKESEQFVNFNHEAEARWNLVEIAWKLNISRNMLRVDIDESLEHIIVFDNSNRRTNVTSARNALSGYQKGYCFYCKSQMIDLSGSLSSIDVDHFFADKLKRAHFKSIDGVSGQETTNAIKEFQSENDVKIDGIITSKIIRNMENKLKADEAEGARKKKEAEEKKVAYRKQREKELADAMNAEETAERASKDQELINRISNNIKRSIESNFNKVGLPDGLECELRVRLVPGGEIIDVSIAKSSGHDIFDRRAVNATQKASPLPVPDDVETFERLDLRAINITLKSTSTYR